MQTKAIANSLFIRKILPSIVLLLQTTRAALAQDTSQPLPVVSHAALPPLPMPLGIPRPAETNDAPYVPQPILQGGIVVPLYLPGSSFLKMDRVREAEQYNMSRAVPGRISSIVNIHNPSIEVHPVDGSLNTGTAIILAAGGGHNTLNVGTESADLVPYFFNYGVTSIILRNRLRHDGYNPQTDAVNDALQAIRLVRAFAKEWNIDPKRIASWDFLRGPNCPLPLRSFLRILTERTIALRIPWPEYPRARIL